MVGKSLQAMEIRAVGAGTVTIVDNQVGLASDDSETVDIRVMRIGHGDCAGTRPT